MARSLQDLLEATSYESAALGQFHSSFVSIIPRLIRIACFATCSRLFNANAESKHICCAFSFTGPSRCGQPTGDRRWSVVWRLNFARNELRRIEFTDSRPKKRGRKAIGGDAAERRKEQNRAAQVIRGLSRLAP